MPAAGRPVPATLVGRTLAAVTLVVAWARQGRTRAVHPRGQLVAGVLTRHGLDPGTGVAWLDEPGTDRVQIRLSRSAGLRPPRPDVLGLAVRVHVDGTPGDLLLATTGSGRLGRLLPRLARDYERASYCSLFPYAAAAGPLLLGARPSVGSSGGFELLCAPLVGRWRPFATLTLPPADSDAGDSEIDFDPVLHPIAGLPSYRWAAELRRYAYAASRRARGHPDI